MPDFSVPPPVAVIKPEDITKTVSEKIAEKSEEAQIVVDPPVSDTTDATPPPVSSDSSDASGMMGEGMFKDLIGQAKKAIAEDLENTDDPEGESTAGGAVIDDELVSQEEIDEEIEEDEIPDDGRIDAEAYISMYEVGIKGGNAFLFTKAHDDKEARARYRNLQSMQSRDDSEQEEFLGLQAYFDWYEKEQEKNRNLQVYPEEFRRVFLEFLAMKIRKSKRQGKYPEWALPAAFVLYPLVSVGGSAFSNYVAKPELFYRKKS